MNNYSIDASVYAFPFSNNLGNAKEIENYCKTIIYISQLVGIKNKEELRHIKYFFFEKDIDFIKNKNLLFPSKAIKQMNVIYKKSNNYIDINDVQIKFQCIIKKIEINNKNSGNYVDDIQKKILFEKWFNIEDITLTNNNYPIPEVDTIINDIDLLENTKKNIAKIAYLNKYIYNNENIHNIILGNNITPKLITVTNWDFSVHMNFGPNNKIKKVYINTQNINISNFDTLINNNCKYSNLWEQALDDAILQFGNHLEFVPDVKKNLNEYVNKINKEKIKLNSKIKKRQIYKYFKERYEYWDEEGPDTLYEYLKAINDFLINVDISKFQKNKDGNYFCRNIKFFGIDCSDENMLAKNNLDVKKDRTIKDSQGNDNIYWMHLKPISMQCDNTLRFLTLRIHFRYLGNGKIEIGLIGRHRYLPCTDANKRANCPPGINCTRHPNYIPKVGKLEDFEAEYYI